MANIIVPRRTPGIVQSPYVIDKNLPICKGINAGFYSGEIGDVVGYDIINNYKALRYGSNLPNNVWKYITKFGEINRKSWGASNQGETVGVTNPIYAGTNRTLLAYFMVEGYTSGTIKAIAGGGFAQPGIYEGYGAVTGRCGSEMRMSNGGYYGTTANSILTTGSFYCMVSTVEILVAISLYLDGIFQNSTSISGLQGYETVWNIYPSPSTGAAGVPSTPIVLQWNRILSDQEIYTISQNPFSILKSTKIGRLYFDVPSTYVGDQPIPWADQGGYVQMGS